jgi:hypothetical protein
MTGGRNAAFPVELGRQVQTDRLNHERWSGPGTLVFHVMTIPFCAAQPWRDPAQGGATPRVTSWHLPCQGIARGRRPFRKARNPLTGRSNKTGRVWQGAEKCRPSGHAERKAANASAWARPAPGRRWSLLRLREQSCRAAVLHRAGRRCLSLSARMAVLFPDSESWSRQGDGQTHSQQCARVRSDLPARSGDLS